MSSLLLNILKSSLINSIKPRNRYYTTTSYLYHKITTTNCASIHKVRQILPNKEDSPCLEQQNDPDTFGLLSPSVKEKEEIDKGDIEEEQFIENPPSNKEKLSTKQYADLIKEHLRNKQIKEAIDVMEVRMKSDRVQPVNYIYNLLIGGCARTGYSKKSFQLFNKMKQCGLKVTGGTYTSLFNACAHAPWQQDGLNKANYLRELMIKKGYEPNASNYNAMIKAYGRCQDIQTAFTLMDEMISKKLDIYVDTLNFLLQACISDKQYGFRHALLVWHKIHQRRLSPDIFSFNLLLRSVRDCGLGDLETTEDVIKQIMLGSRKKDKLIPTSDATAISIDYLNENEIQVVEKSLIENEAIEESSPNLLSKHPHLGSLISLEEIKNAEDRLLLLGGFAGFLREMNLYKVTPDIKTLTVLLEVIPGTNAAERDILAAIKKMEIKCDIDFFNMLIKKRSMRFDYEGAKKVLKMIKVAGLRPDIVTYGVLAMGCSTHENAQEFMEKLKDEDIRMNIQIVGTMLRQACYSYDFDYVTEILDIVKCENMKPNEKFLVHLEDFMKDCNKISRTRGHPVNNKKEFSGDFKKFKQYIGNWKEFMRIRNLNLEDTIDVVREHPWEQFKTSQPEGYEGVKNQKLRHKMKTKRYIGKLKIDELSDGKEKLEI